ncbi:MAG TPA: glycogen synthase [Trueperaceae bacterium]
MRVLFASSEVYPFSKTGGLADVAGALPQALAGLGHEVLVLSPWYRTLVADPAPLWIGDVEVPFENSRSLCGVGTLERDGVRYAFVGHEDFRREQLYGYPDDVRRFARFTRALPQVAARLGFVPDVAHVHDWHSAYLPMLLERGWHLPEGFPGLPSILTVHNVQYQGVSGLDETLYWLQLPEELRQGPMNHAGSANALQAGVAFARAVTTVSPSYAREIQIPAYGYGLDGVFRKNAGKLSGILNGLDTDVWNPTSDPALVERYGVDTLECKGAGKRSVCQRFGLAPERPLLGVVSRLAEQKGIDLLLAAAARLFDMGWSIFMLGSGEQQLEEQVRQLAANRPDRAVAVVGYDETLAHLLYAAADALAVPSRFEPCGLSQMIAMRYGTLPVARATGGLKDTIRPGHTGFLFGPMSAEALLGACEEARIVYGDEGRWRAMMQEAMRQDFSWDRSAQAYDGLYRQTGRTR